MSYDRTNRVQRTTTTTTTRTNGRRNGRYIPPPPPPSGSSSRNHSVLGYWVPLITIGTIAVGGLAAWIWSERGEHDEDIYPPDNKPRPPQGPYPGPPGSQGPPGGYQPGPSGPPPPAPPGGEAASYYNSTRSTTETTTQQVRTDQTFLSRVSGVIGRTPSPQQFFDHASRQVSAGVAGVAAAGAAAGAALGRIMEEDKHEEGYHFEETSQFERRDGREDREGFSDHERWSEEAEEKRRSGVSSISGRREDKGKAKSKKVVAIVLSAELTSDYTHDEDTYIEHGSILSHLPAHFDPASTTLFILIYTPSLTSLPPLNYQPQTTGGRAPSSLGGSYSHISTPATTPGAELASISPRIMPSDDINSSSHFDAVYSQALGLVESSSYIMPFTTADGYVAMLRHLAPQIVYVSDTLSGDEGRVIAGLKGWVGHTVVVAGDDGHGGLADTETETEDERVRKDGKKPAAYRWYDNSSMVGLGKEVEIVDAARIGDDWEKRVGGRE